MRRQKRQGYSPLTRLLSIMLVCAMIFPTGTAKAAGTVAPVDQLIFTYTDDRKGFKVTGYTGGSQYTELEIPAKYDSLPVTEIADNAFSITNSPNVQYLHQIHIPDTVTTIGSHAFYRCVSLEEITIPGSVSTIGSLAFSDCIALKEVYILYGVQTIEDGAFSGCIALNRVAIAPSATELKSDTIFKAAGSITVEANRGSAADDYHDSSLSGDAITHVPLSDDSPAAYAYEKDTNGNTIITDYVGDSLTPKIPEEINGGNVTEIAEGAFQNDPITQVTLPSTLTTIGANAFLGTNLTVVDIPSNVTGIGANAFNDSASVTLKGDSEALDEYLADTDFIKFVLWGPAKSKHHTLTLAAEPANAGTIKVTYRNQTTTQGSAEYRQGSELTIEAAPKPASYDGARYRFIGWSLSSNTTAEGEGPLIDNPDISTTKLTMPKHDATLTANFELVVPDPLVIKHIGNDGVVVAYNGSEDEVVIPDTYYDEDNNDEPFTVNKIGYNSWSYNYGEAFFSAYPKKLTIPNTITSILPQAFREASGMQEFYVIPGGSYCSVDGVLYTSDMSTLVAYPSNRPGSSYTVNSQTRTIAPCAFYNNRNLESIDLSGVVTIGYSAFENAQKLVTVTGNSVQETGASAFESVSTLETVTMPNAIFVRSRAFFDDSNLTSVTMGPVQTIGESAFSNTHSLSHVSMGTVNGVIAALTMSAVTSIGESAFSGARALTSVYLPDSLTSLGAYSFYDCTNLATVSWGPNCGIREIPNYAFAHCAFSEITLPRAVSMSGSQTPAPDDSGSSSTEIRINSYAYAFCENLTTIFVSKNISYLSSDAFCGCNHLERFQVDEGNANYASDEEGVLFNKKMSTLMAYPIGKQNTGSYTVPDTVDRIDNGAFGYAKLSSIVLSNTKTIGSSAFSYSNLTSIDLRSITSIQSSAFEGCSSLTSVVWPEAVTLVPSHAFEGCSSLQEISLPDTVTSIGNYAFYGCTNLVRADNQMPDLSEEQDPPANPSEEPDNPAENPDNPGDTPSEPTPPALPKALQSIGEYAFYGCSSLENAVFPEGLISMGESAYESCASLTEVTLPATLTTMGSEIFRSCTGLTSVVINAAVVPDYAFYGCSALETVDLGHVTSIYSYAFSNSGLTTVTIDGSSIGSDAFSSCSRLATVSLKNLSSTGSYAFSGCSALVNLTLDNVNSIGSYSFYGCSALQAVDFTNITSIGSYAFSSSGLTAVEIDGSTIGSSAFRACPALASASLINTSVGSYAFYGCSALTALTLTSVPSINTYAFYGCTGLTTQTADGTGEAPSNSTPLDLTGVTELKDYAFAGCTGLTNLTLPSSLTSLGFHVFKGCTNLTAYQVDAGSSSYQASDGVLYDSGMTTLLSYPQGKTGSSFTVPVSVTEVSPYAFEAGAVSGSSWSNTAIGSGEDTLKTVIFHQHKDQNDADLTDGSCPSPLHLGHSLFENNSGITDIYANCRTTSFEKTNPYPVKTVFYGFPSTSRMIVHGWMNSPAEEAVRYFGRSYVIFEALDAATQGLIVEVDTTNWSGTIVGYRVADPANESAKTVVVPSSIGAGSQGNFELIHTTIAEDGTKTVETVTLEENQTVTITALGSYAFHYPNEPDGGDGSSNLDFASSITNIRLPETIHTIGLHALSGCSGITSFSIPTSVEKIYPYAFSGCSGLTSITIPKNVDLIGADNMGADGTQTTLYTSVFYGCDNLATIKVDSGNQRYKDINGVLTNYAKTILYEVPAAFAFEQQNGEKIYRVPHGITAIADSAFIDCAARSTQDSETGAGITSGSALTKVYFPASLESIGIGAFRNVLTKVKEDDGTGLCEVIFDQDNEALELQNNAFSGCSGLAKVTFSPFWDADASRIGEGAFSGCSSLTAFDIPQGFSESDLVSKDGILYGVTKDVDPDTGEEVVNYALYMYPAGKKDRTYIIDPTIPVRQIYKSAFQDNTYLEDIQLSDYVQVIQESAFRGCSSLWNITWGASIQKIGGFAFYGTGLSDVVLPGTISEIGDYSFASCTQLYNFVVCNPTAYWGTKASSADPQDRPAQFVFGQTPSKNLKIYGYNTSASTTKAYVTAHSELDGKFNDIVNLSLDTPLEIPTYQIRYSAAEGITVSVTPFPVSDPDITPETTSDLDAAGNPDAISANAGNKVSVRVSDGNGAPVSYTVTTASGVKTHMGVFKDGQSQFQFTMPNADVVISIEFSSNSPADPEENTPVPASVSSSPVIPGEDPLEDIPGKPEE